METLTRYQIEDRSNHAKLYNKYVHKDPVPLTTPMEYHRGITDFSKHKKKIAIWIGPSWEPFNLEKVDTGMAGSETWACYLAGEFSRRGYEVVVYNDPITDNEVDKNGVIYRDYRKYGEYTAYDYLDVFISSRTCEPFSMNLHAQRKYVMVHDIWLSQDPNYDRRDWQVIKYAYLSEWHRDFLIQHHKIDPKKLMPTINGVDHGLYKDVDTVTKKNQAVYSSSPNRGLKDLLVMLPEIRKAVPDFTLKVCYGFFNWESMAKARNNEREIKEIEELKSMMQQPGVEDLGRVDKKTLAQLQMESKVWLFPTWFTETFCVGSVEAGFAKNAILASNYAGLQTTVGGSGILLDGFGGYGGPHPQAYRDRFISEAVRLLTDDGYLKTWADLAHKNAQKYTWAACADGWVKEFGWA